MTRGEIWWVDFGLEYGSMPQARRPAVIVQNDNFNASRIMTTVVIPLTTNTLRTGFPAAERISPPSSPGSTYALHSAS